MPTDFDWKKSRRQQQEPEPSPPPAGFIIAGWIFNAFFYITIGLSAISLWNYTTESANVLRILDNCAEQKGVAIRTLRGDAVCIREDVLTQVLNTKITNQVK